MFYSNSNPFNSEGAPLSQGQRLKNFCEKYEIADQQEKDLMSLKPYDIHFIIDDSGSMSEPLQSHSLNNHDKTITRWDELKHTSKMIIELASCIDEDGVDIHFLNRSFMNKQNETTKTCNNITSFDEVSGLFNQIPTGKTPLFSTLNGVIERYYNDSNQLLIVIATDGAPTDGFEKFASLVKNRTSNKKAKTKDKKTRRRHIRLSFIACSDNDEEIEYLNNFDSKYEGVDVTDDYDSERNEIKDETKRLQFTKGMWLAKALLGPIRKEYDEMDKKKKGFFH